MSIPEEIIKIIGNSGNSFHSKVARLLKKNGWHVTVSPYYLDQSQGKSREIDIVAEKICSTSQWNEDGVIVVRLFIECKFIPAHSVFWFADKDKNSAIELVCSTGIFRKNNSYTEKHHYLFQSNRVAKLFASKNNKEHENEPFYKALNQVLNGMVSLSNKKLSLPQIKNQKIKKILDYPVIVCNSFDFLYAADFDGDIDPEPIKDNFQLEVRYAYIDKSQKQRDDYFLLDIVEFNKFDGFIKAIIEDAKIAAFLAS